MIEDDHRVVMNDLGESGRVLEPCGSSSMRSSISRLDGPPEEYEKMIWALEADIRKHIRIEQ